MSPDRGAMAVVPVVPAIVRVPMYFGQADRRLFGWYHAPLASRAASAAAMVICPPVGHEYVNSHRSLRHLADRLAGAGVPSLRFDYDGTGDSAGREDDPNRLSAWIASVHEAIRALGAESGCERVGLTGLRMGALIAALAACEIDVDCLVLWAPFARGRQYIRELKALDLTTRARPSRFRRSTEFEAAGFLATDEFQHDIARVNLDSLMPRARRVLIAARDDLPEGSLLVEKWLAAGLAVDRKVVPGYSEMMVAPHNATVPHAAIDVIVDWIAARRFAQFPSRWLTQPSRPGAVIHAVHELAVCGIHESVIRFGDAKGLFGIVSEPIAPVGHRTPAIVFSNAGSAHHVGPNRLYVALARALSRAGFICLRLDMPGLGDSAVEDPARENIPYVPEASAVMAAAMDALSRRSGAREFVLAGLCSGAHTAFHAAVDLDRSPIVESVLINPLTFAYKPGMSLDAASEPFVGRWQRYRQSVRSVRGWAKLFRPTLGFTTIGRDVLARLSLVRDRWIALLRLGRAKRGDAAVPTVLAANLQTLAERGRNVTLVFSAFDPGHDLLMIDAGQVVAKLRKIGRISIRVITGANHTFDARGPRGELIRSITDSLTKRYLR